MKKEKKCNLMNHTSLKLSVFVAAASLLFSVQSEALELVKVDPTAAQAKCLPDQIGDSAAVIKEKGVEAYRGSTAKDRPFSATGAKKLVSTDTRALALARVLTTVTSIGDGKFNLHTGAKFVFGNSPQASRQEIDHIQINPGLQNISGVTGSSETPESHAGHNHHGGTTNTAVIAHELGHYAANKGGLYKQYERSVGGRCNISVYAGNKERGRHEEFAEVFAAYVTNPELFKGKNEHCKKALEFLKGTFGEKGNPTCDARKKGGSGAGSLAGGGGADLSSISDLLSGMKKKGKKKAKVKAKECKVFCNKGKYLYGEGKEASTAE